MKRSTSTVAACLGLLLAALVAHAADDQPSYMRQLFEDLTARRKLFQETPEEEIKYWFEYAGPLQVRDCVRACVCDNDD